MNAHNSPSVIPSIHTDSSASELLIPQLVGQFFVSAPSSERSRLIEYLLRPLGVLSVAGVANGIFAKVLFRRGFQDLHVRADDFQDVHASDVIALVDYAQQVSVEAVDGLAQLLAVSPLIATSAAAALLVSLLVQRASARRARAIDDDFPVALS